MFHCRYRAGKQCQEPVQQRGEGLGALGGLPHRGLVTAKMAALDRAEIERRAAAELSPLALMQGAARSSERGGGGPGRDRKAQWFHTQGGTTGDGRGGGGYDR